MKRSVTDRELEQALGRALKARHDYAQVHPNEEVEEQVTQFLETLVAAMDAIEVEPE